MFLNSFLSLLRHSILPQTNSKYKVCSLNYEGANPNVTCELIGENKFIKLDLEEIISNKLHFFGSPDILVLSRAFSEIQKDAGNSLNITKTYYSTLTTAFTVLLLLSNLAETKICNFLGYSVGAGTIIFPLLYILSDVLTEVYGFTASRKAIWIAFCYSCFFSIFIYAVCLLPPSEHWNEQEAFEKIFLVSPRIVLGSVISYFIGEMINTTIIAFLKIKFRGEYFALRAIFSTLIGSLLESTIFGYIAFFGRIPMNELIEMIVLLTLIKVLYEILVMPITIKLVAYLKKIEGLNVFEKPSLKGFLPKFLEAKV